MRLLADSALTVQRGPSLARLEHQEVEKSLPEEPKIDTPLPNTASKVLSGGFNQSHTIHRQPVDFACPLKSLQQHRVLRKGAQLDRPSLAAAPAVENFSTHTACFSRQKIREDGIANFSYRHGAPLVDVHTHSCLCLYIPHRWCGHGQEVGDWFTIVYCQHCLSWPLPKHIQLDTSPWHMDSAASVHLSYVTALRHGTWIRLPVCTSRMSLHFAAGSMVSLMPPLLPSGTNATTSKLPEFTCLVTTAGYHGTGPSWSSSTGG
mmetsp:Transcript_83656/g.157482  ORF Transcript_83656/g.157482 Transcript_83656/m.157482 type:complete len:262 (+) Transcript_83656:493-1278(+)